MIIVSLSSVPTVATPPRPDQTVAADITSWVVISTATARSAPFTNQKDQTVAADIS